MFFLNALIQIPLMSLDGPDRQLHQRSDVPDKEGKELGRSRRELLSRGSLRRL